MEYNAVVLSILSRSVSEKDFNAFVAENDYFYAAWMTKSNRAKLSTYGKLSTYEIKIFCSWFFPRSRKISIIFPKEASFESTIAEN